MARYIDADAVEKRIVDYYDAQLQSYPSSKDNKEKDRLLGGINYGRNVVRDAPTADVVPKSEVAREIEKFEQRVDRIYNHYVFEDTDYSEDDVAVEAAMNALTEVLNALDELKNKYFEQDQDKKK